MINEVEAPTLKPCMCCARPSRIDEFFIDDDPLPWFSATCPVCPIKTYDQRTPEEAARIWNTRTLPAVDVEAAAGKAAEEWFADVASEFGVFAKPRHRDAFEGAKARLAATISKHCAPSEVGELISRADAVQQVRARCAERNFMLSHDIIEMLATIQPAAERDEEIRRFQDGVRDHLIDLGAPDHLIDGAGCDSGDPLDFTKAEITQAFNYFSDQAAVACGCRAVVEKMRDEWTYFQQYHSTYTNGKRDAANEILAALPAPAVEGEAMRAAWRAPVLGCAIPDCEHPNHRITQTIHEAARAELLTTLSDLVERYGREIVTGALAKVGEQ